MVDLSQQDEGGVLWTLFDHAEALGQGLIDLAAFGLVGAALWLSHPQTPEPAPQPLAVTMACEADCITGAALGGPGS
jgi:hypothetical protein